MHIDRPGGFDCLQKQHGTDLLAGAQPFSQHDASAYRDRDFAANKYAKPHLHLNHGANAHGNTAAIYGFRGPFPAVSNVVSGR